MPSQSPPEGQAESLGQSSAASTHEHATAINGPGEAARPDERDRSFSPATLRAANRLCDWHRWGFQPNFPGDSRLVAYAGWIDALDLSGSINSDWAEGGDATYVFTYLTHYDLGSPGIYALRTSGLPSFLPSAWSLNEDGIAMVSPGGGILELQTLNDLPQSYLQDPPLPLLAFVDIRQPYGKLEELALVTILVKLRIAFAIHPSALATTIRFYREESSTRSSGPQSVRYGDYGALSMLSKSTMMIIAQGFYQFDRCGSSSQPLLVVILIQNRPDAEPSAMPEKPINWAEHAQRYFDRGEAQMTETFGQKDLAFRLARMWLRLHWFECFSKAPSRTDLARGIFDLKAAGLNIKGWMSASGFDGVPASPQQTLFETDYGRALEEAKLLQGMLELHNTERALRASNLSIMETRRGLKESHAIGRLTQLAFIFLPLTFITGVFGMNVKPFSDGAPIWKFWVTTCCILIPSWAFGIWTARFEALLRLKHAVMCPGDLRTWYRQNRRLFELLRVCCVSVATRRLVWFQLDREQPNGSQLRRNSWTETRVANVPAQLR